MREHRPISVAFMVAWLGAMVWLATAARDIRAVRFVLMIASMWTVVQVVMRHLNLRRATTPEAATR